MKGVASILNQITVRSKTRRGVTLEVSIRLRRPAPPPDRIAPTTTRPVSIKSLIATPSRRNSGLETTMAPCRAGIDDVLARAGKYGAADCDDQGPGSRSKTLRNVEHYTVKLLKVQIPILFAAVFQRIPKRSRRVAMHLRQKSSPSDVLLTRSPQFQLIPGQASFNGGFASKDCANASVSSRSTPTTDYLVQPDKLRLRTKHIRVQRQLLASQFFFIREIRPRPRFPGTPGEVS